MRDIYVRSMSTVCGMIQATCTLVRTLHGLLGANIGALLCWLLLCCSHPSTNMCRFDKSSPLFPQAGIAGWKVGLDGYKATLPAWQDLVYNPEAPLGSRYSLSGTLGKSLNAANKVNGQRLRS